MELEIARYQTGVDPYLNVVTAQTTLLNNQQTLANLHVQEMTASVQLIEALGGGWDRTQLPTPADVSKKLDKSETAIQSNAREKYGRREMIGDAAQYQELVALYGSYGDEELVALGRGMADLTEMAQEALKGELARRGLKVAVCRRRRLSARILTEDDLADMRSYAELAPAECIFDFEDERSVGCLLCAERRRN